MFSPGIVICTGQSVVVKTLYPYQHFIIGLPGYVNMRIAIMFLREEDQIKFNFNGNWYIVDKIQLMIN